MKYFFGDETLGRSFCCINIRLLQRALADLLGQTRTRGIKTLFFPAPPKIPRPVYCSGHTFLTLLTTLEVLSQCPHGIEGAPTYTSFKDAGVNVHVGVQVRELTKAADGLVKHHVP